MKCRTIKNGNIAWFNSVGIKENTNEWINYEWDDVNNEVFNPVNIWMYKGIYHLDSANIHLYLYENSWLPFIWKGDIGQFYGKDVWLYNGKFHLDMFSYSGYKHFVLNDDDTWIEYEWINPPSPLYGEDIWKYNEVIHFDDGEYHYYLENNEWKEYSWTNGEDVIFNIFGRDFWKKDDEYYYDNIYKLKDNMLLPSDLKTLNDIYIYGYDVHIFKNKYHYDNNEIHLWLDDNIWKEYIWKGDVNITYGSNFWKLYDEYHYDILGWHYRFVDGQAIKVNNYSDNQQGVTDDLIQRLSVLKKELWYNINYGLPLFEKINSKPLTDTAISSIIMEEPDVIQILSFKSQVINKKYYCSVEILSKFGNIHFEL